MHKTGKYFYVLQMIIKKYVVKLSGLSVCCLLLLFQGAI